MANNIFFVSRLRCRSTISVLWG